MTITFGGIIPVLRSFDAARAREFYLDFLGGSVVFEHRFAPDLPLYMRVQLGDAQLDLSEHHGDASPGARIMIATTGLKAYQASLLAKAYRHARPGLVDQPWGATTMTIADPFFNHLVFTEPNDA